MRELYAHIFIIENLPLISFKRLNNNLESKRQQMLSVKCEHLVNILTKENQQKIC